MDATAYRADPGLNFSTLKFAATSALHYQHARDNASKETKALRLGSLNHALILSDMDPVDLAQAHGVEVWAAHRRGKQWQAFKAAHPDALIVTLPELTTALEMRRAVRRHRAAREALEGLTFERALTWTHPSGARLKGRVDGLAEGRGVELKTTLHIAAFAREAARRLYHAQAGLYAHGVEAVTGVFPVWDFVVVENVPPHDVAVRYMDEDDLVRGYRLCEEWIRCVQSATERGVWDGVAPERTKLVLPDWTPTSGEDVILPEDTGATATESDEDY